MLPTGLLFLVLAACGREPTDPRPLADAARFYTALVLEQHAVTLALTHPYDTLQLTATPRNVLGTVPPEVGPVTYTSSSASVTVSPTGLLTAHAVESGVQIVASAYDSLLNVTRVDTVVVNVTATAPAVASLSIQPDPGDSAKLASSGLTGPCRLQPRFLTPAVHASDSTVVPDIAVAFASSDPRVASLGTDGLVHPVRPGHVTFTATVVAYGRVLRDTLPFTIGYPILKQWLILQRTTGPGLPPVNYFHAQPGAWVDTVGVGADIMWGNGWAEPIDIVFDDPTGVSASSYPPECVFSWFPTGSGNIMPWGNDPSDPTPFKTIRLRRFSRVGTYRFHSTLSPDSGRIVVVP